MGFGRIFVGKARPVSPVGNSALIQRAGKNYDGAVLRICLCIGRSQIIAVVLANAVAALVVRHEKDDART